MIDPAGYNLNDLERSLIEKLNTGPDYSHAPFGVMDGVPAVLLNLEQVRFFFQNGLLKPPHRTAECDRPGCGFKMVGYFGGGTPALCQGHEFYTLLAQDARMQQYFCP